MLSFALLTIASPRMLSAPAAAQVAVGLRTIGGVRYVQTQQLIPQPRTRDEIVLVADGDTCSMVYSDHPDSDVNNVYLSTYDRWGRPIVGPLVVDPDAGEYAVHLTARRWEECTVASWYAGAGGPLVRGLYADGQPIGATFLATDQLENASGPAALGVSRERIAVALDGRPVGTSGRGVYLREFDWSGNALSDLIALAVSGAASDLGVWGGCVVRPEGTVVCVYVRGNATPYLMLRRVNPDFTMEPAAQIVARSARARSVSLLEGGAVQVVYHIAPDATEAFVQTFDSYGTPLSAAAPLDAGFGGVGARPDGRLALLYSPVGVQSGVQMRLYDADRQPLGPRFDLPLDGQRPEYETSRFWQPVTYGSRTIWCGWEWPYLPARIYLSTLTPLIAGDMNDDSFVDNGDIDPFVLALTAPEVYESLYPGVPYRFIGDMNDDGAFDNGDIDGFVAALLE